ncbi:MAG: hypothetical protein FJW39_00880 [Acidobacteria bacterium]|nr:hypothetical protein [Acidobacteriota bacterium]
MKRILITTMFAGLLALGWTLGSQPATAQGGPASGQGKYKFKVLFTSSHLPQEAQAVLKGAHGGFVTDLRAGKGETYFALKGAGIIQISKDLKSTRMMPTPEEMKGTNMHNANIWNAPDGKTYLLFPGNESQTVFIVGMDGKLATTLKAPATSDDLGNPGAHAYFSQKGPFIPTDMDQLDGLMYVSTGYSKLDMVLTAKLSVKPVRATWHDLAWGGKGTGIGQFGTGHGITVKGRRIDVADRPHSEIDRFSRHGQYLSTLSLPKGSFPCDIHYLGNYAAVGALHGPDRTKGAPVYLLENDELVSTIMPKEELGLANFQHIHNTIIRELNGKLYLIVQAWNPGDFAILEQVS